MHCNNKRTFLNDIKISIQKYQSVGQKKSKLRFLGVDMDPILTGLNGAGPGYLSC